MNLTGFKSSGSTEGSLKIPWWTRGDTNAFFGLGFNILVNVLTLTSLLIFVVQLPAVEVLGTVLPALGIAMLVGNIYYTILAWPFVIGVIVLIGAFIGPFIRKITPRAAMLGTLAGISLTFISMRPAAQIWEAAWIGLPVLGIILVGFFTNIRLPGGIPVGLAALLVGTAIGW